MMDISAKYPLNATITKLDSTFEIKRTWLYNEWDPVCQFSKFIQTKIPNRENLHPDHKNPNIDLIQSVFNSVRGKYLLWQAPREEGRWKKVIVKELKLNWVLENVEVLYPAKEEFKITELFGIVLWKNQESSNKRYQLYEGNHRVSAWIASKEPSSLPAVLFIGKPKK